MSLSLKIIYFKPAVVVHTYNLTYTGGGDRKITNLRSAQANLLRPNLENKI
jgi:hypothetical protein